MDTDGMFIFLFVFLLLAAGTARGMHWYAAHHVPGRTAAHPDHGLATFATVVMLGQALLLLSLASAFRPEWMRAFMLPLPDSARWIGGIAGMAGIGLFFWLQATLFDSNWRPHRVLKFPESIALVLMVVATVLLTANWLLSALGIMMVVAMLSSPTPLEPTKHRRILQTLTTFATGRRYYSTKKAS